MGHVLGGVSGKHYIRPSIMNIADSFAKAYKDSGDTLLVKNGRHLGYFGIFFKETAGRWTSQTKRYFG